MPGIASGSSYIVSYWNKIGSSFAVTGSTAIKQGKTVNGWTYFEQRQFEESLLMFEKALEFQKQQGDPNKIMIARWCVAKTLRMMDHTEEALEMQRDLYEQYQAADKRSGYVYEEIAECLTVMGEEQEAQGWFAAAYEELSKDPRLATEQDRLNRLKELGRVGG